MLGKFQLNKAWFLGFAVSLVPLVLSLVAFTLWPTKLIAFFLVPLGPWLLAAITVLALGLSARHIFRQLPSKTAFVGNLFSRIWIEPLAFVIATSMVAILGFMPLQTTAFGVLPPQQIVSAQDSLHPAIRTPDWQQKVNVLVVGLDSREGNLAPRPDSITLLRFDPATNLISTFPIYRDSTESWLEPGISLAEKHFGISDCAPYCRLSDLVARVNLEFPELGDNQLISNTSAVLAGVIADEYQLEQLAIVEVDFDWLSGLVDALGGVRVEVSQPIPIGGKWTPNGMIEIRDYIDSGSQVLDGEQALWYARARWGSSNENRVDRQMDLIRRLVEQHSEVELFTAAVGQEGFRTTLSRHQLLQIVLATGVGVPRFE